MDAVRAAVVFVLHIPSGRVWMAKGEGTRPALKVRKAAMLEGLEVLESLIRCAACGVIIAVEAGVTYRDHLIAVAEADRVVNDHPDYLVYDEAGRPARVGYSPATVVAVCPTCNGSSRREFVRDELRDAAAARMDRYAPLA